MSRTGEERTSSERFALRGARVIDPWSGTDAAIDLLVDAGGVRPHTGPAPGATEVDLAGRVVCPAFVEIHAHLREPGGEDAETIATGLAAARAGGYGCVLAMANTRPVNDRPEITRLMLDAAAASGSGVVLHPVSAVTLGLDGCEAAPWRAQLDAGCVALSDDGRPVSDLAMLERALEFCARADVPYLSHAECPSLFHGPIHAGAAAGRLGIEGIPSACESRAVEQEIDLAAHVGARLHVCHVSTRESLAAIRGARARGVRVSAEATPHHLVLSDAAFLERGIDTVLKMNPPLRDEADRSALVEALEDGTVTAVATDHAPHSAARKALPLDRAPFGVIGMETAFPVLHEFLVRGLGWPLRTLIERLTTGPASVIGLPAGRLFEGAPRLVVLDPDAAFRVDPERFRSRSRNCPFAGRTGRGRVVATLFGGDLRTDGG